MSPEQVLGGNILVIKLGALGDFVQAFGPFKAIRDHHPNDDITLLTIAPFKDMARASGLFDRIIVDKKPKLLQFWAWLDLQRRLRQGKFKRVYDLQTSGRSSHYRRLMGRPQPEWSGIAGGCSHPHANPNRDFMHTIERQAEQLSMAGIAETPLPDFSWAEADLRRFDLPRDFALFVPGGAPHRPAKRWPPSQFATLAWNCLHKGITPVLLGGKAEQPVMEAITSGEPKCINLAEKTDILDIAALARKAKFAIGNDSGPMHLISLSDCPSIVLYSHDSDPALCGQRGRAVSILHKPDISTITPDEVLESLVTLTDG